MQPEVELQAAIKFYLNQAAFNRERELYMQPDLQSMMPVTLAIEDNASNDCVTPYGYVFPPFVIIEWGQSLDEWARSNTADFITIFQVCTLQTTFPCRPEKLRAERAHSTCAKVLD